MSFQRCCVLNWRTLIKQLRKSAVSWNFLPASWWAARYPSQLRGAERSPCWSSIATCTRFGLHSSPRAAAHCRDLLRCKLSKNNFVRSRKFGWFNKTYIVTESDISQIVLTQHPVHENDQDIVFAFNVFVLRRKKQIDSEIVGFCHFLALIWRVSTGLMMWKL